LSNPEYRQNANKMKQAIVQTNGLEKAVDLLEDAFKLPQQEQNPWPSER
jgi:UDP:flavonoid glycosyltransferase YjiC (YdhE family)